MGKNEHVNQCGTSEKQPVEKCVRCWRERKRPKMTGQIIITQFGAFYFIIYALSMLG